MFKNLGAGHLMWTHADLYNNQEVSCWTRTQSVTWFGGYVGTVVVMATAADGRYLGETPMQKFGVNGTAFGGSDRTDQWNAPLVVPETPAKLVAVHSWSFDARVLSAIAQNAGTIAAIVGWL
jgi:hypothetical protein